MNFYKKIKNAVEYPGRYFSRRTEPVRNFYQSSRKLFSGSDFRRRRVLAHGIQSSHVQIPKEAGFYFTDSVGFKPVVDEVIAEAESLKKGFNSEQADWDQKDFMFTRLLDLKNLNVNSPFVQFALNEDIIKAASNYLGVVPLLNYIGVWYSRNTPKEKLEASQLYHCDHGDMSQVKVFVYCNDIDELSGPLTFLGADTSAELRKKLKYSWDDRRYRVKDEEAKEHVGFDDQHQLVGKKGTVGFVDTCRCFHYGSRVKDANRSRLVCVFQYLTPYAFVFPYKYNNGSPLKHLSHEGLSDIQKLVLGDS